RTTSTRFPYTTLFRSELGRPVTELDMVRDVRIDGGDVAVTIALTVAGCPLRSSFESQVRETVGALPGVAGVSLAFDVMSPEERQDRKSTRLNSSHVAI